VGFRRLGPDREQGDVPPGEIEGLEVFRFQGLVAEAAFRAQGFARGEGGDFIDGELAFGQDVQHLAAHVARGAGDGEAVSHDPFPLI